jgi:hypothetical protein
MAHRTLAARATAPFASTVVALLASGGAALLLAGTAQAAGAHEHGVARLDVAVDAKRVSILLDTPLESLVGFEREPRTDAEREKVAAALARLRDAQQLFHIDPGAGCTLARVDLQSPALQLGRAAAPAKEGHADLEATFDFACTNGARAGFVEVGLFETFPALTRLDLQVATPKGQLKATLRKPSSRVMLAR